MERQQEGLDLGPYHRRHNVKIEPMLVVGTVLETGGKVLTSLRGVKILLCLDMDLMYSYCYKLV